MWVNISSESSDTLKFKKTLPDPVMNAVPLPVETGIGSFRGVKDAKSSMEKVKCSDAPESNIQTGVRDVFSHSLYNCHLNIYCK